MVKKNRHIAWELFGAFLFGLVFPLPLQVQAQTHAPSDSVRVDRVLVVGNKRTKRYIILRELDFQPGSTVSRRDLERARDRIINLNLFNAVDFHILTFRSENVLKIEVVERWSLFPIPLLNFYEHSFSKVAYGGGVADYNFLGRAQKVFILAWAGFNPGARLVYVNNWFGGRHRLFTFFRLSSVEEANHTRLFEDLKARTLRVRLKLGKRLGPYRWIGLVGETERMHLSDPRAALSPSGTDKIFSAGLSFELDTRDLHTYPARGDLFRLNYFRSWIWEQGQCGTTELDVRHYSRLGPAIVATRLAGTLLQGKVPVYKHIFLGYGERIRGHFTQVAEGKARVQSSLAFRVPLLAPRRVNLSRKMPALQKLEFGLYGVVFGDLGVLWPEQPCWGTGQTWRGGGLGLNFILPYSSVLRTEYAWNESLRGEFILDMMVAF